MISVEKVMMKPLKSWKAWIRAGMMTTRFFIKKVARKIGW
jgi:hypothetical protein